MITEIKMRFMKMNNSSKFIFKYARFQIWKQLIKNKLSFIEISFTS